MSARLEIDLCVIPRVPFSNCLIQNGDLGGEVELINLPLIFVVYCSNYNGAPVKMVSLSTVPPPPVESETLHGRLKRGAPHLHMASLPNNAARFIAETMLGEDDSGHLI